MDPTTPTKNLELAFDQAETMEVEPRETDVEKDPNQVREGIQHGETPYFSGHSGPNDNQPPGILEAQHPGQTHKNMQNHYGMPGLDEGLQRQEIEMENWKNIDGASDFGDDLSDDDPKESEFTPVQHTTNIRQNARRALDKNFIQGVQISRTKDVDSTIHTTDIKNLFELIHDVDKEAMIMQPNKTAKQAQPITWMFQKATGIDFKSFLDISTTNWGRPQDNKKRTTFSFWICSNVIEFGLQALRTNVKIQSYLQYGGCVMNSTNLRESKSKIVAYLQGKDPRHTHRITMAQRITDEILAPLQATVPIACNIITTNINGYRILAIAVGSKDANQVENYLAEHSDEELTMILHKWKRTNPMEFEERLKEHQLIVANSTAFKIQFMDPTCTTAMLRSLRTTTAGSMVVDVCPTGHSAKTGIAYVQFLKGSEATVLSALQHYLASYQQPEDSFFQGPPKIVNATRPDSPTIHSRDTVGYTPEAPTVPKNRWTEILANERINNNLDETLPPLEKPIPQSVTMPKSFSEVLMQGTPFNRGDSDSTITEQTSNARSSRKSVRERALEQENASLKAQLTELQTTFKAQLTEMESKLKSELRSEHAQEISELRSMLDQLLQQTQQTESPNRKKQDTKKSPTKFPYPKPTTRSATRPGTS